MNVLDKWSSLYSFYSAQEHFSQHFACVCPTISQVNSNTRISYNSTRFKFRKKCTHAEEHAINTFLRDYVNIHGPFKGNSKKIHADLLVIRVSKSGHLKNSKPCKHCVMMMSSLKYLHIDNIWYSNDVGDLKKVKLQDLCESIDDCIVTRGNTR
jgi:hypothetical protein